MSAHAATRMGRPRRRVLALTFLLVLPLQAATVQVKNADKLKPEPDQQHLWTCSCFALTGLLQWQDLQEEREHTQFSAMHLYYHYQQYRLMEGAFEGGLMDISYLLRIASLYGVVPEERYPYRLQAGSFDQTLNQQWPAVFNRLREETKDFAPRHMLDHFFHPPVSIQMPPRDGFFLRREDYVLLANPKLIRNAAEWVKRTEDKPEFHIRYNVRNYLQSDDYLKAAFDETHASAEPLFKRLIQELSDGKAVLMGYMDDGETAPTLGSKHWHFIVAVGYDDEQQVVRARNSWGRPDFSTYPFQFLREKLFQLVCVRNPALKRHEKPDVDGYPNLLGKPEWDSEEVLALLRKEQWPQGALAKAGLTAKEAIVLSDLHAGRWPERLTKPALREFLDNLKESVETGRCTRLRW